MELEITKNVLAYVLRRECGGEPKEGQFAVASVIWNRSGKKISNIFDVLRKPRQFSCLNGKDLEKIANTKCTDVNINHLVDYMLSGTFETSLSFTNYYNPTLCTPYWGEKLKHKTKIGNHLFGDF